MANKENKRNAPWQTAESDQLDCELNTALARYASVEPRAGLEERILANLRSEPTRVSHRAWWRWSVAAALMAVVLVVVALVWRSGKPTIAAKHPSTLQGAIQPEIMAAAARSNEGHGGRTSPHRKTVHRANAPAFAEVHPKLDQFPSPQPLSEQEKILANYVAQFHEKAVLLARLRTEELRQEQLEQIRAVSSDSTPTDSER